MNKFIHISIITALKSIWNGNIPIGVVLVQNNKIIKTFMNKSKFQHAEIELVEYIYNNNIKNVDIYINMEPCVMCWFLLNNIKKYINVIIFASWNIKYGGISNNIKWIQRKYIKYHGGVDENINNIILKSYFMIKR